MVSMAYRMARSGMRSEGFGEEAESGGRWSGHGGRVMEVEDVGIAVVVVVAKKPH